MILLLVCAIIVILVIISVYKEKAPEITTPFSPVSTQSLFINPTVTETITTTSI